MTVDSVSRAWRQAARGRLRLELAGLAFACQRGFAPQEYARHLWDKGAVRWMGQATPTAAEYLCKEAQAFRTFYPDLLFDIVEAGDERAELVFNGGCLGGWGRNRWAVAKSLGLPREALCAYCREAFGTWAAQLGLRASIGPEGDDNCRLRVVRPGAGQPSSERLGE